MKSGWNLAFFLSATTGVLGFLCPDGAIAVAEGCSGIGPAYCTSPGWESASLSHPAGDVPTDGVVALTLGATFTCKPAKEKEEEEVGDLEIRVEKPDGELVPGSPSLVKAPPPKDLYIWKENKTVVWRPDAPLLPSTTYKVRLLGFAGGTSDYLLFKTGKGPFQLPKPVLYNPKLEPRQEPSGKEVCCVIKFSECLGVDRKCAKQTIHYVPYFSADVLAEAATKAEEELFFTELQLSINDGPFFPITYGSDIKPERAKVCARAAAIHRQTKEESFSDTWCGSTEDMVLEPRANCEGILGVYSACEFDVNTGKSSGSSSAQLESLQGDPIAVYQEVCQHQPPADPPPAAPPPTAPPPGAGAVPEEAGGSADVHGGCGCAAPGTGARGVGLWPGVGLGVALLGRRRRRVAGSEQGARGHAGPW
jgi:MYXO-CTERM domain-containing protein